MFTLRLINLGINNLLIPSCCSDKLPKKEVLYSGPGRPHGISLLPDPEAYGGTRFPATAYKDLQYLNIGST
jgi:hypothetical protein